MIRLITSYHARRFQNGISSGRDSHWGGLLDLLAHECLLYHNAFTESFEGIFALQLFKLHGSILVEELIDGEVSTADTDVDLILHDSNGDSTGAKLVDTLALSEEHDLHLLSLWVVVDELSQSHIDLIISEWYVDAHPLSQFDYVLLQLVDFFIGLFKLLEKLQRGLIRIVYFLFQIIDVITSLKKLLLKSRLLLRL